MSAASGGSLGRDLPREDGFISTSISHGLHWMDFAPNQDFFKSLSCFIKNLKKRKVICKIGYIRSMLRLSSSKKISTFISLLLFFNCFFHYLPFVSDHSIKEQLAAGQQVGQGKGEVDRKNTKNWFTILDSFHNSFTIILQLFLQYFYNTYFNTLTILDTWNNI